MNCESDHLIDLVLTAILMSLLIGLLATCVAAVVYAARADSVAMGGAEKCHAMSCNDGSQAWFDRGNLACRCGGAK